MRSEPLTTVIIPCWNAAELTRVCLEQVVRNTTGRYELVLVDDGSRDGAWLRSWSARLRAPHLVRMRLLRSAVNRGYPAAMNQGLLAARGELLVFGNADAAPAPLWLEQMRAVFDRWPAVGGLSPCSNPPSAGRRAPWSFQPWYRDLRGMARFSAACSLAGGAKDFVPARGFVPGFWFMTTRKLIHRLGAFDERFSPGGFEDWDMQLRIRRTGKLLGFAGRAYVHHEWMGVMRSNGMDGQAHYERMRILFRKKHPAFSSRRLLWRPPIGAAHRR